VRVERQGRVPLGTWNPLNLSVTWRPTGPSKGRMRDRSMGPWLCVPALRRVCRFEVELADLTAAAVFRFQRLRASVTVSAKTVGYYAGGVKILGTWKRNAEIRMAKDETK
jgi:hypothetical protein